MSENLPEAEGNEDDGHLETARITITRTLTVDGQDIVYLEMPTDLSLVEILGLLRYAEDSAIRGRMDDLSTED
jgi:hypothetical protein